MSQIIRRNLREREEEEFQRLYSDQELQASDLRKLFLHNHIINFDTK
jgi:hypothetical protein